jgi:mRNA-degrading endonuclease HigB of HigAB toxin-antitoxin module
MLTNVVVTKKEVVQLRGILILLILFIFLSPAYAATVYKWVDKEGVVNFTDDLSKVPPSYRNRVEMEERKDAKEELTPQPARPVTRGDEEEEMKTDIYGRDETWWREKVRPWKEKLKEATEKYEAAEKKYTEKSDELSRRRFGSPTQYKMNIIELDKVREEKEKYQAKISEANAMLEKLSKEAQESKADPAWLE